MPERPLERLPQRSSEGPSLIQLTIQNEAEKKKREEERKKAEAAARKAAAAKSAADKAKMAKPAEGSLPFPAPINLMREVIRPNPKDTNPILGFLKGAARAADRGSQMALEGLVEAVPTTALTLVSAWTRFSPFNKIQKAMGLPVAELPKKLDPLEREYREWDLGLPKSEAGNEAVKVGADIISFAGTTIGLARSLPATGLTKLAQNSGKLTQAAVAGATGLPASMAASWLLTKQGDPNLANLVDRLPFVPAAAKPYLKLGLATDDKDSAFTSKAKAMITDGLVGAPLDALTFFFAARKWTQGLLKAGVKEEEAVARGVAAAAEEVTQSKTARRKVADQEWPEATQAQFAEMQTKLEQLQVRQAELKNKQLELPLDAVSPDPTGAPKQLELGAAQSTPVIPRTAGEVADEASPAANPKLDPDEIELQRIEKQIQETLDDMDELEAELATPSELKAPNEVRGSDEAVPADVALRDQVALERTIPAGAKRTDIPPGLAKAPATAPVLGKPRHTYTDAAAKIMSTDPKATKRVMATLRKTLEDKTLTLLAKESSLSKNQLIEQALDVITKFRGADVQAMDKEALLDFFRQEGIFKNVQDPTLNVADAELLNPVGVVALKTMVTDTAADIYNLSKGLLKDDQLLRAMPGNHADRLIDRIMVLHDLHQMSAQIDGRNLAAYQLTATGKSARGTNKINTQKFGPDGNPVSADDLDRARRMELKRWADNAKRAFRRGNHAEYADEMRKIASALVLAGGDPLKTRTMWELLREGLWKNTMTQWYNSVLSGTATVIRAGAGNFNSFLATPVATGMSGLFKGDVRMMKAGVAAYRGITDSVWDALKVARDTASLNEGLMADAKYIVELQADNTNLVALRTSLEASGDYSPAQDLALRWLEGSAAFNQSWLGSFPERFMLGIDDFTKVISSRAKIAMDASYQAFNEGGTKADFERVYADMKAKRITDTFEIKDDDLFDYAKMATFQGDPGGLVKGLELMTEALPPLKLLVPFVRTPAEVMNYQWELLPVLNNLSHRYRRIMKLKPGDEGFDPVLRAEMEGRQAVGAMAVTAATIAAWEGTITGNGPPPGPQRQLWLQENRPKSIKTPFGWVSYAPIDPMQAWLALSCDVVDLIKMGHADEAEKVQSMLAFGFAMSITDRSMLQGVAGLGAFLNPKGAGFMDTVDAGFWSMANGFIPYAGMRQAFKNSFDPVAKEIEGHINKVFDNVLPGYYQQHPSKVDPLTGLEKHSMTGGVWNAFVPFHLSNDNFPKGSPEEKAQRIVGYLTKAGWDSSTLLTKSYAGGDLTPYERSAFAKALHKEGLAEALLDLFENDQFVKVGIEAWAATGNSGTARDQPFYFAITNTINQVKKRAFNTMLADNPNLAERQVLKYKQNSLLEQGQAAEAESLQKQIDDLVKMKPANSPR